MARNNERGLWLDPRMLCHWQGLGFLMLLNEPIPGALPSAIDPNAVLTIDQVASCLQIGVRSVERLNLPCIYLGARTRRYLGKHLLAYLESRVT